jgi:hypothetical protein
MDGAYRIQSVVVLRFRRDVVVVGSAYHSNFSS